MDGPSELETDTIEGLTRLLRFAIQLRGRDADLSELKRLEGRFDLSTYEPQFRGALEDFARHLDGFGEDERFIEVCKLIARALPDDASLNDELFEALLKASCSEETVRFSFETSLLLCLHRARLTRPARRNRYPGYDIRYAGIGPDRQLMAFASLFLDLPVYTESNPPWEPDQLFDDGEPITESPGLEISFPPSEFSMNDAPDLETSVRKYRLPRAVDRGKYDLESVMLEYLCGTTSQALVFVSERFLTSTKQSRLMARQHLMDMGRVRRVAAFSEPQDKRHLVELAWGEGPSETIQMVSTNTVQRFVGSDPYSRDIRGKSRTVPTQEVRTSGDFLSPTRYLTTGPVGGPSIAAHFRNLMTATQYPLSDLFDIIRPKTTKNDPVGTLTIHEVSAGNLATYGELSGPFRSVNLRATVERRLDEQRIRPRDILFAHRGPVGCVAYVSEEDLDNMSLWAGQTLLIIRPRRKYVQSSDMPSCDPRALFMYLLTAKVQESWQGKATDRRSPAIPIGEVERFGVPESLVLRKNAKKPSHSPEAESASNLFLSEYQRLRQNRAKIREIEARMNDGLDRVWGAVWSRPKSEDEK
ncbi:hypothetical protein KUV65_17785 [Maritalea mobilis]|uniref:hypothetical protein n=1 Tax=Maritalea mobilis TaxID=483324 RepID=UPI001C95554B|nr:hypothetical protein [Maritalea mobilis]MBY6203223.1 hypothetical protein [Maritalea mobilis]